MRTAPTKALTTSQIETQIARYYTILERIAEALERLAYPDVDILGLTTRETAMLEQLKLIVRPKAAES